MNYLYVSKKKTAPTPGGLWLGTLVVFILIAFLVAWRFSFFSLLTSWWRGEANVIQGAATASYWFSDKEYLSAEIVKLKNENADLQTRMLAFEAKIKAYDDLVYENGTSTPEGILVKIIRRPPFTVFDTYIVDKGSDNGIEVGDTAYARNVPVGSVKSVTERNATVKLYSSPEEKTLFSLGTSSSQYEATGVGNAHMKAEIPRDEDIHEGEEVTANDRGVSIYGTVTAIDKETSATNKTIFIALPFDINETGWMIIKKSE
jgi:cell shape-determining protein MreC